MIFHTRKQKHIAAGSILTALLLTGSFAVWNLHDTEQTTLISAEENTAAEQESKKVGNENLPVISGPFGDDNGMTGRAKSMLQYNSDSVGWIIVPGTKVDNPIVMSDDNAYYLSTGFNHKPYRAGTVFLDYRDDFDFGQDSWSDNLILYGHNMANNEMFGSLRRYRQDYSYWKENQFIELYSNFEHATYVIFALPITYGGADAEWRYWDWQWFPTEEDFQTYVNYAKQKSVTAIDNVDLQYGDKIITLSTCYSDADDSRFLVIARKLRDGETAQSFTKS